MRIIAVSDTHQNTALLRQSVQQAMEDGKIDVFIHCGDGVRDIHCVEKALLASNPNIRIYAVRGNCDVGAFPYPVTETIDLNGIRTLITHGYIHHVKHGLGMLSKAARSLHAQLAFFGHTHQPLVKEKHGITLINPGSFADTAYAEVIIGENRMFRAKLIPWGLKGIDN